MRIVHVSTLIWGDRTGKWDASHSSSWAQFPTSHHPIFNLGKHEIKSRKLKSLLWKFVQSQLTLDVYLLYNNRQYCCLKMWKVRKSANSEMSWIKNGFSKITFFCKLIMEGLDWQLSQWWYCCFWESDLFPWYLKKCHFYLRASSEFMYFSVFSSLCLFRLNFYCIKTRL